MTPLALLTRLCEAGVTLTLAGAADLRYRAPLGVVKDDLLQAIRTHKAALHDLVEAFEERAALAEYCGGVPRVEAERLAWQCVLGEEATTARTEGCAVPVGEPSS
jgi:hypothetical protein